ncbi:MAG: hypothetical protein J4432_03870 [DPANN group archaeon]|nr:hypothetical protein [DPANN group archaeon]
MWNEPILEYKSDGALAKRRAALVNAVDELSTYGDDPGARTLRKEFEAEIVGIEGHFALLCDADGRTTERGNLIVGHPDKS